MPHAGGGGHSGGGSHSGSHSSVPRYDHRGNLHSPYYYRPGFYVHNRYVPYTRRGRRSPINYISSIILFIVTLVFAAIIVSQVNTKGEYSDSKLETFAYNKYGQIYHEGTSDYEKKILVTFIAYEDNAQYDYLSMIGDDIDASTDAVFDKDHNTFGISLTNHVPAENYYSNLYSYLADALEIINDEFETNPIYGGNHGFGTASDINIINESEFGEISGEAELEAQCVRFYTLRGYNISFLVSNTNKAYGTDWSIVIGLGVFGLILVAFGIRGFIQKRKDIKEVEEEIKKGNAEKLYEGEDPFEEYYKDHPID